jgi:lipopolysaccharide transport system permease protein
MSKRTSLDGHAEGRGDAPVLRLDNRPESLGRWLGGLWRYRGVLVVLARKDFRVRYKRASLGILWSVAVPLFQTAVLVFIFSRVGRFGSGAAYSYAGFVLAGMVPWLYVSSSLPSSTTSIVDASSLTDKVFFPRAVLPLVAPCANLVSLAISTLILLVALPIVGQGWTPHLLLVIPATVLVWTFSAALGLALGGLYVYFRDLKFMVQAVILVWLYVTPIVYPASALKGAGPWLDFNPLTGIVGLFQRAAVDAPVPSTRALVVSVVTTIVVAVVAVLGHRRHDRLFVDLL